MVRQANNIVYVTLIKTKGCEACNITEKIFNKVLYIYNGCKNIIFSIVDSSIVDKDYKRNLQIKDYPTITISNTFYTEQNINNTKIILGSTNMNNIFSAINEFK